MNEPELYSTDEICQIFKLARSSIYRRLREARAGRGGLPLPIPTGAKRSLRWDAESVRMFLQSANSTPQTPPTLEIESEKSRKARHAKAMQQLERFGIKAPKKEQE